MLAPLIPPVIDKKINTDSHNTTHKNILTVPYFVFFVCMSETHPNAINYIFVFNLATQCDGTGCKQPLVRINSNSVKRAVAISVVEQ